MAKVNGSASCKWTGKNKKGLCRSHWSNVDPRSRAQKKKEDALSFFIINTESFSRGLGEEKIKPLLDFYSQFMMVIVDESSTIKNRTAKRTKNLIKICRSIPYKRILSGTPVTKSPLDLFSQCDFLEPGLLGVTNFYAFRARYAVMHTITGARNFPIVKYCASIILQTLEFLFLFFDQIHLYGGVRGF